MGKQLAAILLFGIFTIICNGEEDDCTYWKCDGYKSSDNSTEYEECALNNSYWTSGDIYSCKYCQMFVDGVCYCASKQDCQHSNLLIFGISLMLLSLLCTAIIWYKYLQKYREMMIAKKLLLQKERRKEKSKSRSKRKSKIQSKNKRENTYSTTLTGLAAGNEIEKDSVEHADGEYSDPFLSDNQPYSSEDSQLQKISNTLENINTIQNEIDKMSQYNCKCVSVWIVTIICCLTFIFGLGVIIYDL